MAHWENVDASAAVGKKVPSWLGWQIEGVLKEYLAQDEVRIKNLKAGGIIP